MINLLETIMVNPSNIVKYGKLLENTWDGDGEVAWR